MKTHKTRFQVLEWIREYCLATSQHGYKFIALSGQTMLERSLWFIVLVIGMCAAIWMVFIEWGKNDTNPTLIALDTAHYPVWNIDFPAVTLCGINRIRKSTAFNLSNEWVLPSGITRDQVYRDLILLAELIDMEDSNKANVGRLQLILDMNNISAKDALKRVMLPCEDMVIKCMLKGTIADCRQYFTVLTTPYGYCCSFNYRGNKVNAIESILSPSGTEKPGTSYRTSACGFQMGLTVLIDNHIEEYYGTSLASQGVKVLLHNPFDYPHDNIDERVLSAGSLMMVSVYPETFQTTAAVRSVGIQKRNCLLREERILKNLQRYTYSNCYVECRHNYSFQLCGCSPFYYPNLAGRRICNLTDVSCFKNHKYELLHMDQKFQNITKFEHVTEETAINYAPCNCLPECTDLFYRIETSESDLERRNPISLTSVPFFEDVQLRHDHSLLHVYFIDLVGTRYMRNMYYTWHQLLASIGGILSLFLGFTIISALEAIYFFTIRVYFTIIRSPVHPEETGPSIVNSITSGPPVSTGRYFISSQVARTPTRSMVFVDRNKISTAHMGVSNLV